jgi:hypothetical protein
MTFYLLKMMHMQKNLRIRIRTFLGLLDPDLLAGGTDPDPSIIKQKY